MAEPTRITRRSRPTRRIPTIRVGLAAAVGALALLASACLPYNGGGMTRITRPTSYEPFIFSAVSGGGRYVAYTAMAPSGTGGPPSGHADVWVKDRLTGATSQLTAGNGDSAAPAVSADGRFVSWASEATDLVPGDTNGQVDVFVWDRSTDATTRITDGSAASASPSVSGDGRYVAYWSTANDLLPGDPARTDVFVWDRTTGITRRLTEGHGESVHPSISADGRSIAFESTAPDLVPGQSTPGLNAYVVDRATGVVTLVSDPALGGSAPSISGTGLFIAYQSGADVYLWQRIGVTLRLTHGNAPSITPAIAADGSTVAFTSQASDLAPSDTNGNSDAFRWDRGTAAITRLTDADAPFTSLPAVSADGAHITFSSTASNVVAGDVAGTGDVFAWDRSGSTIGSS